MVPKGWSRSKIADIAEIAVGRDLKEESFSDTKSEDFLYPVYSNTVSERGLYGYYNFAEHIGEAVTVVGRGIGIGTAFSRKEPFGAIGRLLVLKPKQNSFDVIYFENYINNYLRISNESGGIPQLPGSSLAKYDVVLPPLQEQQKIAKILSTWDKAISTTERLIDNSQQQKKALMQQLLTGNQRLLDDSGVRFSGDWEMCKLENIVLKTQLGTSERTKDLEELSTIPLIKMGNLTWGGFSFDKLETLPRSKVDNNLILKKGDFLFNTRNTPELVGKSAVWKEQKLEATFDNNINKIIFHTNIDTDFICLYLTYGKGKSLISSLSAGSTSVAAIYWKDLKNIKIPVPILVEQQKIATVLTNADREIELLQQQLADLQQEKRALMQQLLTGKRRVVV